MSVVTNVLLSTGTLEEVTLGQINAAIEQDGQQFNSLVDDTAGRGGELWGGSKYPEATVYAAAFNYLRLDELMAALASLPWTEPAYVQLFVQGQHDDVFSVFMFSAASNGATWRKLA